MRRMSSAVKACSVSARTSPSVPSASSVAIAASSSGNVPSLAQPFRTDANAIAGVARALSHGAPRARPRVGPRPPEAARLRRPRGVSSAVFTRVPSAARVAARRTRHERSLRQIFGWGEARPRGAQREAQRLNHNYIGTEHLLLGLVDVEEGHALAVLRELGAAPDDVRRRRDASAA
jgi:hypothetical protein